jgi:hypothetical protein
VALKFTPVVIRMNKSRKAVSRREFARTAALGAGAAALLPLATPVPDLLARAELQSATDGAAGLAPSSAQAPGVPQLDARAAAEADARYQNILGQYGERFSEAQKTDLKRLCAVLQPQLERVRAYTVGNGDLPALYLKPLVDRDKKPVAANGGKPGAGAKTLAGGKS